MNWDAIGSIGEIVGAIAVVVSLIYLAVQVRQNTKIVAANTFQAVSSSASYTSMEIAQSPHLSRLVLKLFGENGDLSPEESMQAQLVFRAIFRNYENYFYQYSRGYFEEEVWDGYMRTMSEQLSIPFGQTWWKNHQKAFGSTFVEFVNRELLGQEQSAVPWTATQSSLTQPSSNGEAPPNKSVESDT